MQISSRLNNHKPAAVIYLNWPGANLSIIKNILVGIPGINKNLFVQHLEISSVWWFPIPSR